MVPINDFLSYIEDGYYEKHEISVEVLHDPTNKTVETDETGSPTKAKKKEDYIKELAEILEVEVTSIDPTSTIAKLKELIEEAKASKAAAGAGGANEGEGTGLGPDEGEE